MPLESPRSLAHSEMQEWLHEPNGPRNVGFIRSKPFEVAAWRVLLLQAACGLARPDQQCSKHSGGRAAFLRSSLAFRDSLTARNLRLARSSAPSGHRAS